MDALHLISVASLKFLGVHDYILIEINKGNITLSVEPECYIYKLHEGLIEKCRELSTNSTRVFHIIKTMEGSYIFLLANLRERVIDSNNFSCYIQGNDFEGMSRVDVEVYNGGLRTRTWVEKSLNDIL